MEAIFKTWKTSRQMYLGLIASLSTEDLNKIPTGFSNNLIWNIGHIIVVHHGLIYSGSNLKGHIPDYLSDKYKPGSQPSQNTSQEEINELKTLLSSTIEETYQDYKDGIFTSYNERTTGTGFHLKDIQDALVFNNYHEGIHLGLMLNIKKFI